MRVVRIYHEGRDPAHRARDRALVRAGVELTLVVPRSWPGPDGGLDEEPFDVVELDVGRAGDVNRHRWRGDLPRLLDRLAPEVVDVHEEPVSVAGRQWLRAAGRRPVVMYSAQNLDKRWPPPFAGYERDALRTAAGLYACSRQAASVLRGKGYAGRLEVLPLGVDVGLFPRGVQQLTADKEVVLLFAGRLVSQKGGLDALHTLAAVRTHHRARLVVVGSGPQADELTQRTAELGLQDHVERHPWVDGETLAALYRRTHIVLVPSRATPSWTEQFGRVVVEAWSSGAVPVAYASGSLPEVLGEGGVLVVESDIDALARAVLDLIDRPAEWRRRRDTTPGGYATWEQVAARQAELYAAVTMSAAAKAPVGRPAARQEFGPPARTPVSDRPFALPVLRSSRALHRLVQPPRRSEQQAGR